VTRSGDDYAVMRTTRYTYDDIVEALVRGEGVAGEHASLATFAREVQALGDEPVPTPSADLAALLEGRGAGVARLVSSTGKAAGLGIVAKLGLSASLAAAGVVGAGAAGLLPAAANHAVRGAIEVVTPVQFDEPNEHPATFGDRVSSDATGESDGENGVDGQQISDEAPGADNRNGGSSPDAAPGQTGATGQTRADQTPAGSAPGQTDDDETDDEEQAPNSDQGQNQTPNSTVPPARADNQPPG
jgi:hypothetical protein